MQWRMAVIGLVFLIALYVGSSAPAMLIAVEYGWVDVWTVAYRPILWLSFTAWMSPPIVWWFNAWGAADEFDLARFKYASQLT